MGGVFTHRLGMNGAGGGAEPAFWVRTVRVAMNTAAGSQDLIDPTLAWTPKAVRAIHIGNTADGATSGSSSVRGAVGAYDGTNQWSVAWLTYVTGGLECAADSTYLIRAFAAGADRTVTATALIPGGVRVTNGGTSNASFITLELFGGTAMQAKAGTTSLGAQNTPITVTTGLTTNALFVDSVSVAFGASGGTPPVFSGVASWDGTTLRQCAAEAYFNTPGGTRDARGLVRADGVMCEVGSNSYVELGSITSTNFTLTPRLVNYTGNHIGWLALSFGGAAQAWAGVVDSPTATGSKVFSGPSFTPSFASLRTNRVTATNTAQTNGEGFAFSYASIHANAQYSNHWRSTDNAGSGGTVGDYAEADSKAINTSDHRSLNDIDATFTSFGSGTMTLNFTSAFGTACKWPVLFIG